jgi:hypothetical protein
MRDIHMNSAYLKKTLLLAGISLAFCGWAAAQDPSSASAQSPSAEKKTPPKPKKTWTEDDVSSLRSPADKYVDEQAQAQAAAAQAKNPSSVQSAAAKAVPRDKPPRLSDPKTVDSADTMIAWEDRDIAAQEEFVARLKEQRDAAPLSEQPALEGKIADRERIIANTRAERDGLVAQRDQLRQKAAAPAGKAASQPPQ